MTTTPNQRDDSAPAPADALPAAVSRFIDLFTSTDTAYEVGPHLQCSEADALADLLRAAGHRNAADVWLHAHAATDDEGDAHDPATGRRKA